MFSIQSIIKQIFLSLVTGALGVFLGLELKMTETGATSKASNTVSVETVSYPVSPSLPKELRTCISEENEIRL